MSAHHERRSHLATPGEPLRSAALVAGLVGLPAAGYLAVVLVPSVGVEQVGPHEGNLLGVVVTALALLGAVVALAASSSALSSHVRRGRSTAGTTSWVPWLLIALVSLAVVGWFLTPGSNALTSALVDWTGPRNVRTRERRRVDESDPPAGSSR